jgi:hypothetical protein
MFARRSEPEGHTREFEKPKGCDDGCFCGVVRMKWNLMVCFHQIYCGEESPANKLLCKFGNVPNGILVGDDPSFQRTIVQGLQASSFLGTWWRAKDQGLWERRAVPFRSISSKSDFVIWKQSGTSRRWREVTGRPGVVRRHTSPEAGVCPTC